MGLNKLGKYITECQLTNEKDIYKEDAVVGISTQKQIIKTKANLDGVKLSSYKLLPPKHFAYVPDTSRRGDKMSLCYNNSDSTYLVSSISVVFFVSDEDNLSADYLFMYFNRPEFDRYSRFHSWGSARESFTWDDMCNIELELPSLSIQQKYVDVYNAMVANQKCYEQGLDDLKLVCDAYIEDLRRNTPCEEIGKYSILVDERNVEEKVKNVQGLTVYKKFIDTKADMEGVSLSNYKVVRQGDIAYVPTTNRNGDRIACGLCGKECIVSSIYEVLRTQKEMLLPEYLFLWFKRAEFDRWVRYNSWGSARETIEWNEIGKYRIPVPTIERQKAIVDIFNSYQERSDLVEKLRAQSKNICPILIKGSFEEARREA